MNRKTKPIFVIQEHDATSHHYDFRIEVEGTLKSWAIPKGLSTDPDDRRLAIRTDDHDMDYADFEGLIPEGEYGAGTVLVWDGGHYDNLTQDDGETVPVAEALDKGHAVIRLEGKKLVGGYALQRIRDDDNEQWLIIKIDDDDADARRNPVSTEPESIKTGRTLEEVARDES